MGRTLDEEYGPLCYNDPMDAFGPEIKTRRGNTSEGAKRGWAERRRREAQANATQLAPHLGRAAAQPER